MLQTFFGFENLTNCTGSYRTSSVKLYQLQIYEEN